jgi:hypothetical protein
MQYKQLSLHIPFHYLNLSPPDHAPDAVNAVGIKSTKINGKRGDTDPVPGQRAPGTDGDPANREKLRLEREM